MRALFSGISRGTESLVFRGEVPQSQYVAMRAPFQEGTLPGPIKYGYSSVGEVVEQADSSGANLEGQTVFCLYPHQDLYLVQGSAVTPLPPDTLTHTSHSLLPSPSPSPLALTLIPICSTLALAH